MTLAQLIFCIQHSFTKISIQLINLGSQCHAVLLDENSSSSCQEQCNLCKYGSTQAATTKGTEASMQTSSIDSTHCDECLDANVSLDTESVCSACSGVCPRNHPFFCTLCRLHVNECIGTTTLGTANTELSYLPSWSLKWCPRRIQGNPNRHFQFFHFVKFYIF